jgi:hypothetical protein
MGGCGVSPAHGSGAAAVSGTGVKSSGRQSSGVDCLGSGREESSPATLRSHDFMRVGLRATALRDG